MRGNELRVQVILDVDGKRIFYGLMSMLCVLGMCACVLGMFVCVGYAMCLLMCVGDRSIR